MKRAWTGDVGGPGRPLMFDEAVALVCLMAPGERAAVGKFGS